MKVYCYGCETPRRLLKPYIPTTGSWGDYTLVSQPIEENL